MTKKNFLQLVFHLILIIAALQFLGCSSTRQSNPQIITIDSKSVNEPSGNSSNENNSNAVSEEFINEWKNKFEAASAELESNCHLWQENKIESYDFVIAKYAGGNTNEWNRLPVLIKVRNGQKASIEVESKSDNSYMTRTDGFEDFDAIDKLFNYLRQELSDGDIIDANYDKKFGYPKSVFAKSPFGGVHNYRTIQISKFKVVK